MIVYLLPAPQRAFPDGREPAGLIGLAAAAEYVAAGDQRDVAGEETHRLLLEAQLLLRLAVLEVALAERLLDRRNAAARAVPGHESDVFVVRSEMARQVAGIECIR